MNAAQRTWLGFLMIGGVVAGLWLGLGSRPAAIVPPPRISPGDRALFDHPVYHESIAADQRPPVLSEATSPEEAWDWKAVLSRIAAACGALLLSFIRLAGRVGWRLLLRILPILLLLLAAAVDIELPFLGGGAGSLATSCIEGMVEHGEWVAAMQGVEGCLPG